MCVQKSNTIILCVYTYSFSSIYIFSFVCIVWVSCKYWDKDWSWQGGQMESCVVNVGWESEWEKRKRERNEDVFPLVWSLAPTANIDVVQIYTSWCSIGIGCLVWCNIGDQLSLENVSNMGLGTQQEQSSQAAAHKEAHPRKKWPREDLCGYV